MDLTIEDFVENIDEIATLNELLLLEDEEVESPEELEYFNSKQYRSKIYKFLKELNVEQRDIINSSLIIGQWLCTAPERKEHEYLNDLNLQEVQVKDVERWCARIRVVKETNEYLKTFTKVYLQESI